MADALRIALLVKGLPLHRPGGLENHAWTLAKGLTARGHQVTIVTTAHPEGRGDSESEGIHIVHLPRTRAGANTWGLFRLMAYWVNENEAPFDLIHAQGFAGMFVRATRPVLTTVHGTVWSETPLHRSVRPMLSADEMLEAIWRFKARTLLGPLAHRAWRRADRLIVDSEFTKGELRRVCPERAALMDVVPLGTDLPASVPQRGDDLSERRIHLLFVGRLERVKGIEDLLKALRDFAPKQRFRLDIVGDGPHRAALAAEVEQMGLRDTAKVHGRMDEAALEALWREADVFVNPEWSQPAFGLTTVEALGWGLPVLGTQTGATPEIVTEEVGTLVPPGQPQALGRVLTAWAEDPRPLLAKRAKCRERAAMYTVENMVVGTEAAYRKAL